MRPVNLLPERVRPRTPTGGQKGSGYFLLGGLALVLAAAVLYVLTLNSINSAKDKIATANAATARDNALASQLAPYGDFQKIKAQRVAAVLQLANSRSDWERNMRELSRLLPDGVWLTTVAASQSGKPAQGSATTQTSQGGSGPLLTIDGCATNQAQVAVALVRMREIQGASDVQLAHSTKPSPSGASAASSSDSTSCGTTGGSLNYAFEANVTLTPQSGNTAAPASLGGGS